jgi:cytochrome c551/c552
MRRIKRSSLNLAVLMCMAAGSFIGSCNWNANTPGISATPEAAAEAAYAAVPSPEISLELQDRGKRIFDASGCLSCHSKTTDRNGLMGPPLGGIADRVLARHDNDTLKARRWLVMHIRDPFKYPSPFKDDPDFKGMHMPPTSRVTDTDMRALVEYLWLLR